MSTPDNTAKMVFISHASQDAETARNVCRLLEDRGVSCWIAPRDVSPGGRYGEQIVHAIGDAKALVLILSEKANASNAVANEVERAFANRKLIIPLRLADVKASHALEFFIGQAQWIDLWGGAIEEKVDQVARAVAGGAADFLSRRPRARPLTARLKAALPLAACLLILAGAAWFYANARQKPFRTNPQEFVVKTAPHIEAAAEPGLLPRYQALVVGINQYVEHAGHGWQPLGTARPDAEAVASALEKDYNFTVTRLFDGAATRGALTAALDSLVTLGPNDACIVYFAGHGYYDENLGEGYWIPADARKTDGERLAKEDWLWNSTITKIIGASCARHILVIADSCYGGSLFRGEGEAHPRNDLHWYGRAISKPSRYLIASGDVEPVMDSGARHSIFAQELLNYLGYADRKIFSASDLGMSLREKVSAMTPQMVQMGPLAVGGHAGGEFVFVHRGADKEFAASIQPPVVENGVAMRGDAPVPAATNKAERQQMLRSALDLSRGGATNAAARLIAAAGGDANDRLSSAVAAYLNQEQQARTRTSLNSLIATLDTRKAGGGTAATDTARPRIIACLGPEIPAGTGGDEGDALLYRLCLRSELQAIGRVQVVEREALEKVLQEMNLGSSSLADARVKTEIGRLLPAGVLLLGDLFSTKQGDRLFMRLVDTETSRVLASVKAERTGDADIADVCRKLAADLTEKMLKAKPLTAKATSIKPDRLDAGIGSFQGADPAMAFDIVQRSGSDPAPGSAEKLLGKARIDTLGDTASSFKPAWSDGVDPKGVRDLWIREVTP